MKVKVDESLCSGHGRCWVYAKDVYELDDNGYNKCRGKIVDVPAGHEENARKGAVNCPERAIEIIEG